MKTRSKIPPSSKSQSQDHAQIFWTMTVGFFLILAAFFQLNYRGPTVTSTEVVPLKNEAENSRGIAQDKKQKSQPKMQSAIKDARQSSFSLPKNRS